MQPAARFSIRGIAALLGAFGVLAAGCGGAGSDPTDAALAGDSAPAAPVADAAPPDLGTVDACVPSAEVCDGFDNDCSGAVDDGIDCLRSSGSARDGELTISSRRSLGARLASVHAVATIAGSILSVTEPMTGLARGDEVLIINLGGGPNDFASVGNWETGFVETASGIQIGLRAPLKKIHGASGGNAYIDGQRVVVMRVPHFSQLTIASTGALTAGGPGEPPYGVVFFRAQSVTVAAGGAIDTAGAGYPGAGHAADGRHGDSGASISGPVATVRGGPPNQGGGGGGKSDCDVEKCTAQTKGAGGGGAGHGTGGVKGANNGGLHKGGEHGLTYGDPMLVRLFLGSGGGGGAGGGGGPKDGTPGGHGGGLVAIFAGSITVNGTISSAGSPGAFNNNCNSGGAGGGGGGAGGIVWLSARTLTLVPPDAQLSLSARGGAGACNGGGDGGQGRTRLDFATLNGHAAGAPKAGEAAATVSDPVPGALVELP